MTKEDPSPNRGKGAIDFWLLLADGAHPSGTDYEFLDRAGFHYGLGDPMECDEEIPEFSTSGDLRIKRAQFAIYEDCLPADDQDYQVEVGQTSIHQEDDQWSWENPTEADEW